MVAEGTKGTTRDKKGLVLELWVKKGGIISQVCQAANINRKTFYRWLEKDKKFAEAVAEKDEELIDYTEGKLMLQIDKGNLTAIIFFLKCKGKDRGWVERHEFGGPGGKPIPVKLYDFDPGGLPEK